MSNKEIDTFRAKKCDEDAKRLEQYSPEILKILSFELDKYNEAMDPLCHDMMCLVKEAAALYDYTKRIDYRWRSSGKVSG